MEEFKELALLLTLFELFPFPNVKGSREQINDDESAQEVNVELDISEPTWHPEVRPDH